MKGAKIAGGAFVTVLVLLALVQTKWALEQYIGPGSATSPAPTPSNGPAEEATQDFLYGRVTTDDATYEGRLRFGGDEEAFWGNYFNGVKDDNPWSDYVPPERLARKRSRSKSSGSRSPSGSVRSTSAGH